MKGREAHDAQGLPLRRVGLDVNSDAGTPVQETCNPLEVLRDTTSRGHRRGLDADATGRKCEASPGTVLRFKEMDAASYTFSTLDPVSPCGRRNQSTK